jgi:hypothetical protein
MDIETKYKGCFTTDKCGENNSKCIHGELDTSTGELLTYEYFYENPSFFSPSTDAKRVHVIYGKIAYPRNDNLKNNYKSMPVVLTDLMKTVNGDTAVGTLGCVGKIGQYYSNRILINATDEMCKIDHISCDVDGLIDWFRLLCYDNEIFSPENFNQTRIAPVFKAPTILKSPILIDFRGVKLQVDVKITTIANCSIFWGDAHIHPIVKITIESDVPIKYNDMRDALKYTLVLFRLVSCTNFSVRSLWIKNKHQNEKAKVVDKLFTTSFDKCTTIYGIEYKNCDLSLIIKKYFSFIQTANFHTERQIGVNRFLNYDLLNYDIITNYDFLRRYSFLVSIFHACGGTKEKELFEDIPQQLNIHALDLKHIRNGTIHGVKKSITIDVTRGSEELLICFLYKLYKQLEVAFENMPITQWKNDLYHYYPIKDGDDATNKTTNKYSSCK